MAVGVAGLGLEDYWVHGAGAAKIGWGLPGSFDRCVTHLGKYVKDPKGLCAEYHHAATGKWPGQKKGRSMDWYDQGGSLPPGMTLARNTTGRAEQVAGAERAAGMGMDMGNVQTAAAADMNAAARKYCAAQGWAMPDGSYPIRPANMHGAEDLDAAIRAVGRGNAPHDAIRRHIIKRADAIGMSERIPGNWKASGANSADPAGEYRTVPFELGDVRGNGDGLTFEGYAAVYNSPTRISGWNGDFDEQIAPGAFRSVADGKHPVLMFEHGKHPLIGTMPLGRITSAREDPKGLWIEARLTDNWLIQPVRDAVRDKAVTGMSFRFLPPGDDDQRWAERSGQPDLRTLLRLDVPELGPVVFPAYEPTTAAIRSALDNFEDFTGRDSARSAPGGERMDAAPGSGSPSSSEHRKALRDRAWKMRSIR